MDIKPAIVSITGASARPLPARRCNETVVRAAFDVPAAGRQQVRVDEITRQVHPGLSAEGAGDLRHGRA